MSSVFIFFSVSSGNFSISANLFANSARPTPPSLLSSESITFMLISVPSSSLITAMALVVLSKASDGNAVTRKKISCANAFAFLPDPMFASNDCNSNVFAAPCVLIETFSAVLSVPSLPSNILIIDSTWSGFANLFASKNCICTSKSCASSADPKPAVVNSSCLNTFSSLSFANFARTRSAAVSKSVPLNTSFTLPFNASKYASSSASPPKNAVVVVFCAISLNCFKARFIVFDISA